MSYFEEEYLHIISEESIAIMEWKGLAKTEAYRRGFEAFLEMLEEGEHTLWLTDFTGGKVIDIKDQKWTTSEWLDRALEVVGDSLKKVAVILSTDIFNKVAVRLIMNALTQNTDAEVAYFEDKDDAMEWLMTHENEDELAETSST
jgi:hypothetical protein